MNSAFVLLYVRRPENTTPPPLFTDIGKAKASSHGLPPFPQQIGSVRVLADGKFAGHSWGCLGRSVFVFELDYAP